MLKNNALFFIFLTVLIDCIGIGIIIPVIPGLIKELAGVDLSGASRYGGYLMFSYAIVQFVMAPFLGALSDRFGRRPVLLISLLGLGIDYIFLALAPSLAWLFAGRIIAGICGASFTTASAYIADISAPEKRAQNFGLMGAAFGLGFIIGPFLGAFFSTYGLRVPFIAAAVLSLLNFIYGYFILPESLSADNRRKFELKRANPIGGLISMNKYPSLILLFVAVLLFNMAGQAMPAIWTYFTMFQFNWDEAHVGYSLVFVGVTVAIVQGGLIRKIIPKTGQVNAVYIGMVLSISGFLMFSFADQGWMMYAIMIPYALAGIAGPALQGLMSTKVAANEQGELQGMLTSLMSLASIFGPVLMTTVFSIYSKKENWLYYPGAPFFMSAVLSGLSLLLAIVALKKHFR